MANWTLQEWRDTLDDVLHVSSDYYSRERKDRAIRSAANEFRRLAEVGRVTDDTLNATSAAATLDCSGISGFTSDQLIYAKVFEDTIYYPLTLWSPENYYEHQAYNVQSARPRYIAFESETDALLWPTPDAAYDLRFVFVGPLYTGTWTIGQGNGTTVTINIDERFAVKVAEFGAAPMVSYEDPVARLGSNAHAAFLDFCRSVRGRNRPPIGSRTKDMAAYLP